MYAVSSQYQEDIKKSYREWDFKATFTYKNASGTVVKELTKNDVVISSVRVESGCVPGSVFEFGAAISKTFSIKIQNKNEEYNNCTINGGTIVPYVGLVLSTGATEWIPLGTFYIYKASKPLRVIKIDASDFMIKFEKKYATGLIFPTTLKSIVDEICTQTGIELYGDFENSSYSISDYRSSNALYSYREILKAIAVAAGGYVVITRDNRLKIESFNISSSPYLIDPDTMRIASEYEDIKTFTCLLYRQLSNNLMYGNDDTTPIIIQNNLILNSLAESDLESLLNSLYEKYTGFSYIPYSVDMRCDPCLDEGDTVSFNKTTDGTVRSFIGEYIFTLAGKYKIKSPGTSELDSDFLINKYDTENQSTSSESGPTAPVVNPNLLLISQFTRAFLPYYFVNTWSYSAFNSGGVECLCSYYMGEYINRIWLPFQGDMVEGDTYTLSLYMKKTNSYSYTGKYYVCLVPFYNVAQGSKILLNSLARKTDVPVDGSGTTILGTIQLTDQWAWHTLTFTAPASLPYQNDENITAPGYGYMIALYSEQALYTSAESHKYYACFIHRAKLEKGSVATAWCLGETEKAAVSEELDFDGDVTHTVAGNVNSLIAEYNFDNLEIAPSTIHYNEHGLTMIQRQKMIGTELDLANQIVFTQQDTGNLNHVARTETDFNKYYVTITSGIDDKSLKINAPDGLYINGTLYTPCECTTEEETTE